MITDFPDVLVDDNRLGYGFTSSVKIRDYLGQIRVLKSGISETIIIREKIRVVWDVYSFLENYVKFQAVMADIILKYERIRHI